MMARQSSAWTRCSRGLKTPPQSPAELAEQVRRAKAEKKANRTRLPRTTGKSAQI